MSNHFAAAVEAEAIAEWHRIRARQPSIPNTQDVRSAFIVGFSIGVHHGMKIDVNGIAQKIASEFAGKS